MHHTREQPGCLARAVLSPPRLYVIDDLDELVVVVVRDEVGGRVAGGSGDEDDVRVLGSRSSGRVGL